MRVRDEQGNDEEGLFLPFLRKLPPDNLRPKRKTQSGAVEGTGGWQGGRDFFGGALAGVGFFAKKGIKAEGF